MAGALAGHADALAILVEKDGDGNKRAGEKRKECARPADAEVAVGSSSEEGESSTEHGTNEIVSGEDTRGVGGICVSEVV